MIMVMGVSSDKVGVSSNEVRHNVIIININTTWKPKDKENIK